MNRTKRTPEKEGAFLAGLMTGVSVEAAAWRAGVGRSTVYEWRDADEEFRQRWDEAYRIGTSVGEEEVRRRAIEGVEVPVYQGGRLAGHKREYSDVLLLAWLRRRDPEHWHPQRNAHLNVSTTNQTYVLPPPSPADVTTLIQVLNDAGALAGLLEAGTAAGANAIDAEGYAVAADDARSGYGAGNGFTQRTV